MLRDRPAMAQFGEKAAVLYHWAARKFAGEDLHEQLFWDATEPRSFEADNWSPTADAAGRIRIRRTYFDGVKKGKEVSFEEMWERAVFELYNIASTPDFQRLNQEAAAGQLTKETFVVKIIECESRAAEKTRAFYIHVFLPWARDQYLPTDPSKWLIAGRADSRQNLLLRHIEKPGPYWRHYEQRYDANLLDTLLCNGENRKASELVAKMREQATTSEEEAKIYVQRGCAYEDKGDYEKAVADFNEAIRLNPKDANALCGRGRAYHDMGDHKKAVADFAEAVRVQPTLFDAYYSCGVAYSWMCDDDKAIAQFTEAIRLKPKLRGPLCYAGIRLLPERQPRQSHRRLQRGHPTEPEGLICL